MTTTTRDTPDSKPGRKRAPQQRTRAATEPKGYAKARAAFEERTQDWLLDRPGRIVVVPDDLRLVAAHGVPCSDCGALIYRDGDAGHTIEWNQQSGRHWTSGIVAYCR